MLGVCNDQLPVCPTLQRKATHASQLVERARLLGATAVLGQQVEELVVQDIVMDVRSVFAPASAVNDEQLPTAEVAATRLQSRAVCGERQTCMSNESHRR